MLPCKLQALADGSYRGALGAVCVFSVHDPSSYDHIVNLWLKEIAANVNPRCAIALVAAKGDLPTVTNLSAAKVIPSEHYTYKH